MHRKFYIYIVLLLVSACGKKPTVDAKGTVNDVAAIRQLRGEYLPLTRRQLDVYTFVVQPNAHCDSLLFTSLYAASGGEGVDLVKAKDESGLWERHPSRDCDSTISKDMYIGLFTWLWQSKNLAEVTSLIHAGESHNWVMGQGPAGMVVMTPNLMATLYEIRYRLGGPDGLNRHLYNDQAEGKGLTGFQAHLLVIHTLLRGSLTGGVTETQLSRLKEQAEREPHNALFQVAYHRYTDGDQTQAISDLEGVCPVHRLPTTQDRCDDYLWQRDEKPSDWAPCPKNPDWTFNGVDCEVAAALVEGVLD